MNEEFKKLEFSNRLFIVFLILVLGILGFFVASTVFKFRSIDYPREITITTEGRVFAKPDIALARLGVTSEGMEVKIVIKENTEKMNAVLKEIRNLGIEEKDIQTIRYNLTPRYEWIKEGQRIFKGYVLEQEVRVKIRNFEKIGEVIEKATEKGANIVGDLFFTIDDLEAVREKAREEAIKRAMDKANKMAAQTGIRLGKLVNVYEDYHYPVYPIGMMKNYGGLETGVPTAPEIQPGEQEVTVRINLGYRVK